MNRWCVTGTPIRDSLMDFHGLMVFLGIDPYNMEQWWRRRLCIPYISGNKARLESVLARYMWRTAKKDVLNQIDIPEQTEEIHFLQFSPIEEHFYRRQVRPLEQFYSVYLQKMICLEGKCKLSSGRYCSLSFVPLTLLAQSWNHQGL